MEERRSKRHRDKKLKMLMPEYLSCNANDAQVQWQLVYCVLQVFVTKKLSLANV